MTEASFDNNQSAIDRGPWLHGTNNSFEHWLVPPPKKFCDRLTTPHSAVFLTKHKDFAAGAGAQICSAFLTPQAKVVVPEVESPASEQLRRALLSKPVLNRCDWLRSDAVWRKSWNTGEVMRFAADPIVLLCLVNRGAKLLSEAFPKLPQGEILQVAKHNVTRGWIEEILIVAHALGFDALQGHEIDSRPGAVKISRPWLAVLNSHSLSEPVW